MMRTLIALIVLMKLPLVAFAQAPVAVPNPMASHTIFIVMILAAFLAWAASFSVTTRRERVRKTDPKALRAHRESILDKLAAAEAERKSGALTQNEFNKKTRRLRGQLAAVLAQLQQLSGEEQKAR